MKWEMQHGKHAYTFEASDAADIERHVAFRLNMSREYLTFEHVTDEVFVIRKKSGRRIARCIPAAD